MDRTTIYLDAELKRRLKDAATQARVSEASMIREALTLYLVKNECVALLPVGRSSDGGVASRDEQALEELGFGRE